jgi:hypothetical protein
MEIERKIQKVLENTWLLERHKPYHSIQNSYHIGFVSIASYCDNRNEYFLILKNKLDSQAQVKTSAQ